MKGRYVSKEFVLLAEIVATGSTGGTLLVLFGPPILTTLTEYLMTKKDLEDFCFSSKWVNEADARDILWFLLLSEYYKDLANIAAAVIGDDD